MSAKNPLLATIVFGTISIALYIMLLLNSEWLIELAQRTKNGEKFLFLVPIIVAFVFSYVHGAFTGHFWESVGLRASNNATKHNK